METCIKEEKVAGRQKHTDPQPVPNPINESSKSSHKTTVGGVLVLLAWVLLILQSMALSEQLLGNFNEEGQGWEKFKYLLQQSPQGAMGFAIGSFIGINILPLFATILGLITWLYQKNKNGKIIVSVGVVLILVYSLVLL